MKRVLLLSFALVFALLQQVYAQSTTVSGRVTDQATGAGLPGVSVVVKGTTVGATTGADGAYTVSVPAGSNTLVFRYIGYANVERAIGNASTINVGLSVDDKQLSELVVVGYGVTTEKLSTQSIATVDAESFRNTPLTSPQQLLQGQAAGVQMTNSSGVLGAASSVRIRGAASITAGGDPLYVIDGVPLNNSDSYSQLQGGSARLNPLLNINPNDIESMSVLKDAAAVAIYGSRGANGVVLINTKSGSKNQKTVVSFDYFTGISQPTKLLKYMSAEEYATFRNTYGAAQSATFKPATYDLTNTYDWVEGVVQTGKVSSYNVSARGGNEKTTFYIGGTYSDESGFTIGNELEKLSGRLNLKHDVTENIEVGVNYSLSNSDMRRVGLENSTAAPLTGAYLQSPFVTPYGADGQFQNTGFIVNSIAQDALTKNDFNLMRSTGNAYAQVTFLKDFKFKTDWGIDLLETDSKYRNPDLLSPGGYGYRSNVSDNKWLVTNTLHYNKFLAESGHTFGVLLGHSYETSRFDDIFVEGSGFASDDLPNVASASTPISTSASGSAWALESYFGRVNYDYNSKYLFEATLRRDGSSRFGADYKYGTFYAASVGWVLTEENFLQNANFLNFLKLTSSYGTAGNDQIGNFAYLGLFSGGGGADYNGQAGLIPTTVANSDLRWEETAQFDVTLNATVFERLDLEVSYYNKETVSLLANQPYPYTTGFASATRNIGEMRNRGVDLMITSRNIATDDFQWTTTLNMGFLDNEILSLPANKDAEGRDFLAGSTAQRAIVGEDLNTFYLVRYAGINPETGDAQWLTKDGEITTTYASSNAVIVGSAIPDYTGGFTNTFRYKAFDLNAFFNFSYGNKVLIDGLRFTENPGGAFNKSTDLLDYWTPENKDAFFPALSSPTAPFFNRLSTSQLQDGSYLRLKTFSVGYNVPTELLSKTRVFSTARVYLLGQNLWTLTADNFRGPDPEVSASGGNNQIAGESFFALPQPRTITAGVNLTF
ncbi:SusC/RagA family TonB-linked outer membrane protein [Pontibacter toksunensis]|uniref:SusC/RagA family TonB-linked outer membrane protein n=1 Tax=Pontibacter toksunensis TaxID=1332631 RepID=A0ABW6BVP9_9BACT